MRGHVRGDLLEHLRGRDLRVHLRADMRGDLPGDVRRRNVLRDVRDLSDRVREHLQHVLRDVRDLPAVLSGAGSHANVRRAVRRLGKP